MINTDYIHIYIKSLLFIFFLAYIYYYIANIQHELHIHINNYII